VDTNEKPQEVVEALDEVFQTGQVPQPEVPAPPPEVQIVPPAPPAAEDGAPADPAAGGASPRHGPALGDYTRELREEFEEHGQGGEMLP
jgi:hypothetical protein